MLRLTKLHPYQVALVVIGVVDAIINCSNLISISPLPLEMLAMGIFGVAIVYFKIEARLHGAKGLWLTGAIITWWSFLQFFCLIVASGLPPLEGDTGIVVKPPEIVRLEEAVKTAKDAVAETDGKLKDTSAMTRTYEMQLRADRPKQVELLDKANAALTKAEAEVKKEGKVFGLEVFGKIPYLISRIGRNGVVEAFAIIIALLIGMVMGTFIEWFMIHIAALVQTVNKKPEEELKEPVVVPEDKNVISERQYIMAAWPSDSLIVNMPDTLSKSRKWPIVECEALHAKLFKDVPFEATPIGNRPRISREQFMKQRRAK